LNLLIQHTPVCQAARHKRPAGILVHGRAERAALPAVNDVRFRDAGAAGLRAEEEEDGCGCGCGEKTEETEAVHGFRGGLSVLNNIVELGKTMIRLRCEACVCGCVCEANFL